MAFQPQASISADSEQQVVNIFDQALILRYLHLNQKRNFKLVGSISVTSHFLFDVVNRAKVTEVGTEHSRGSRRQPLYDSILKV